MYILHKNSIDTIMFTNSILQKLLLYDKTPFFPTYTNRKNASLTTKPKKEHFWFLEICFNARRSILFQLSKECFSNRRKKKRMYEFLNNTNIQKSSNSFQFGSQKVPCCCQRNRWKVVHQTAFFFAHNRSGIYCGTLELEKFNKMFLLWYG